MKLVFDPDPGNIPPEEYDFMPSRLLSSEAEAIEELKGVPWESFEQFGQLFLKGNAKAHRAALWIMMQRKGQTIKFQDLDYPLNALDITFTDEEAERFIGSIRDNPDLDEEQKEYLIKSLDLAVYDGQLKDGTDLKEPLPNSGNGDLKSVTQDSVQVSAS